MCLYIDRWVSAGLLAEIYPSSLVQSLELGWSAIVRVSYRVSVILKEVLKKYKNDQLSCNGSLYLFVLDALIAIVVTHSVENRHAHIHAPTRRHIWNNHTIWHSEHVKNQEDMKQSISVVQTTEQYQLP